MHAAWVVRRSAGRIAAPHVAREASAVAMGAPPAAVFVRSYACVPAAVAMRGVQCPTGRPVACASENLRLRRLSKAHHGPWCYADSPLHEAASAAHSIPFGFPGTYAMLCSRPLRSHFYRNQKRCLSQIRASSLQQIRQDRKNLQSAPPSGREPSCENRDHCMQASKQEHVQP